MHITMHIFTEVVYSSTPFNWLFVYIKGAKMNAFHVMSISQVWCLKRNVFTVWCYLKPVGKYICMAFYSNSIDLLGCTGMSINPYNINPQIYYFRKQIYNIFSNLYIKKFHTCSNSNQCFILTPHLTYFLQLRVHLYFWKIHNRK